jgi:hypothetical protein
MVERLDQLNETFIGGENDNGKFSTESEAPADFRPLNEIIIIRKEEFLPMYDFSFRTEEEGIPNLQEAKILDAWEGLKDGQYKVYPDEKGTSFDILIRIGKYAILLNKTDGTAINIAEKCGQDALRSIMNSYIQELFLLLRETSN